MKIRFLIIAAILSCYSFATPPVDEGRAIFQSRCAACHNINKTLTGPALAGVDERRSIDWIISFVHSSQTLVKNGDQQAVALFNQFNRIPMPDHPDLSDDNIKNVVAYIKSASQNETAAPFATPSKIRPLHVPLGMNNYGFFISFFILVALLVGVLLFAVQVKEHQRSSQGQ